MNRVKSRWQTSELASMFLDGVRGAIPGAELQLDVIKKVVEQWCPGVVEILDLGCGDGILGRCLLDRFPACRVTFVDFSEPMLHALGGRLADKARASVVAGDFSTPAWLDGLPPGTRFDVVVSGFAIHHQPDARKREIYAEIHKLLAPGGVFLNLEHVASPTSAVEGLFDDYFIDHLHDFHGRRGAGEPRPAVAEKYFNRPDKVENILAPVETQCGWLRSIGFVDVDCFLKLFELALFGGRKAVPESNAPGPRRSMARSGGRKR